jgi:biopolymer transport protein ExbD
LSFAEPVFVSLQDNGVINVGTRNTGEVPASWATLATALRQKSGGDPSRQVLVRADQKVPYADVMRLMDALHRGGYKNKTLVTEDVVD